VHRGRRSGRPRETVLEVLRFEAELRTAYVLSARGRRSQWLRNVQAAPPLELRIGRERLVPRMRILPPDEAARELARYEQAHPLLRPGVRRPLGRRAGIPYDGSELARRQVVERLPVVAFGSFR
jgi:deazaflavin-dependent oxidoreductase (nitroreductase family)